MKEKTKWIKNCPKCGGVLYYSSNGNLKRAMKLNTNCVKCSNTDISKRNCASMKLSGENHPLYGVFGENHPNYGNRHSSDTCKKISNGLKGRIVSIDTREKISKSLTGGLRSNSSRQKQSKTNSGKKLSKSHIQSIRKATINRISNSIFNGYQIIPSYNKSSIPIIEQKACELGITDLQHAENGGEYHIKELGYWVDGYSSEKNIVIEYDERHHFDINGNLKEKDKLRQKEITEYLGCKFIRISEK